jgi:hypothetical protein
MDITPLIPYVFVDAVIKPRLGVKVKTGLWAQFGIFATAKTI